jgi:hypothetical protein
MFFIYLPVERVFILGIYSFFWKYISLWELLNGELGNWELGLGIENGIAQD